MIRLLLSLLSLPLSILAAIVRTADRMLALCQGDAAVCQRM